MKLREVFIYFSYKNNLETHENLLQQVNQHYCINLNKMVHLMCILLEYN